MRLPAEFDPQPMHLDEAAGAATLLGGLGASGWHSCSLLMRIIVDGFIFNSSSMGAPGVEEVNWLRPLRPGTNRAGAHDGDGDAGVEKLGPNSAWSNSISRCSMTPTRF